MSDQINLLTMTIPELQEMITSSVKSVLAAWTPTQEPAQSEKKFLSWKGFCE